MTAMAACLSPRAHNGGAGKVPGSWSPKGQAHSSRSVPVRPRPTSTELLQRRGLRLEYATLGWNVISLAVSAAAALQTGSPALAGFGLGSLIEIFASLVVVWQLKGAHADREARAMRLLGAGFAVLVTDLIIQLIVVFATGGRPAVSMLAIIWMALTFLIMLTLAWGKFRTGAGPGRPGTQSGRESDPG